MNLGILRNFIANQEMSVVLQTHAEQRYGIRVGRVTSFNWKLNNKIFFWKIRT